MKKWKLVINMINWNIVYTIYIYILYILVTFASLHHPCVQGPAGRER